MENRSWKETTLILGLWFMVVLVTLAYPLVGVIGAFAAWEVTNNLLHKKDDEDPE